MEEADKDLAVLKGFLGEDDADVASVVASHRELYELLDKPGTWSTTMRPSARRNASSPHARVWIGSGLPMRRPSFRRSRFGQERQSSAAANPERHWHSPSPYSSGCSGSRRAFGRGRPLPPASLNARRRSGKRASQKLRYGRWMLAMPS